MKITMIGTQISNANPERVCLALLAAFQPFGSLTEGVNGKALAEAMVDFVAASNSDQPGKVAKLVSLVWEATTDQTSTVEVGGWEVSLRTPNSGTKIRLQRCAGGYYIEVDFGAKGSESRSRTILAAAEKSGVKFDVYSGQERIERGDVLGALLKDAEDSFKCLERTERGYYSEEYLTQALARARKDFEFFIALQ